jgi:hypothetical protein
LLALPGVSFPSRRPSLPWQLGRTPAGFAVDCQRHK